MMPMDDRVRRRRLGCVSEQVSNSSESRLVVFSGGSAFNSAASVLKDRANLGVTYVLPVSDDGGSTAEIQRCLGGPAIGDIRSRCLRLADDSDEEAASVKNILAHRLPVESSTQAWEEWLKIVEGSHDHWTGVSKAYKNTILAFLSHFRSEVEHQCFEFRNGSIGNFFFAGARSFFNSLEAAIFVFSRVARIPEASKVVPAALTDETIRLSVELESGQIIHGQNNISHPDGQKLAPCHLLSPIRRVFYSHPAEGLEANPALIDSLISADAIVYGMGSLYTSIAASLILKGTADVISTKCVPKILIVNGNYDGESEYTSGRLSASGFVEALAQALNSHGTAYPVSDFVSAIIVPVDGEVHVDETRLKELGVVDLHRVRSTYVDGRYLYDDDELVELLEELSRP